jgi:hypothetical protein
VLIMANKRLALLDGLSTRIPSVNQFISMYVRNWTVITCLK